MTDEETVGFAEAESLALVARVLPARQSCLKEAENKPSGW
jgi:hypothetical protein